MILLNYKNMSMTKRIILSLHCFIFLIGNAQTTVTIGAIADNTIYQSPASNSNALGQNIFSGTNGGGSPRRGLMKFDVAAAIPSGAIITAVTLTLNCNLSRAQADTVFLHKLTASWGEGTSNAGSGTDGAGVAATTNDATWLTRFFSTINWTSNGGDYITTPSAGISIDNTGFFSWSSPTMINDVQNWLNNSLNNFGWIIICNEATAATARKFGSRENTTIANRPSLSITYTNPIPVTLTYFKGIKQGDGVLLNWQTAQEINNNYFDIQHSNDGIHFSSIGKINGIGNSSTFHNYHYTHIPNKTGQQFYKLFQTDFDGKKIAFPIVKVDYYLPISSIDVYPNPTANVLIITTTILVQKMRYQIYSGEGKLVIENSLTSNMIDVNKLTAGNYYLVLFDDDKQVSKTKFIKK